jgi:alanyl-tRNA synthetase
VGRDASNFQPSDLTMTDRLYYTDSYLTSFDAEVRSSAQVGDRFHVVLDRTAFYPSSGGQPFDTGRLGDRSIVDVVDDDTGEVVHVVSGPIEPGQRVHGDVDWPRRLDHMQQHTGQHMLSAAFDRLFGVRTVSFHLGTEGSTIDLAREVSAAELDHAESEANRVVWEDRPVTVRFVTAAEAADLPLRKEPVRGGTLRVVEVPDFDLSACGGTHVARTGVVGLIAVAGVERFKGASRVSFVCGGRALGSHRTLRDVVHAATRGLSVTPLEVKGAIERLQSEAREAARLGRRLQDELAVFRASKLREGAEAIGPFRVVLRSEPDLDGAGLKSLASAVVDGSGLVVVFTGRGVPVPVIVARSTDVSIDAAVLLRELASQLGGRGGGTAAIAQGGLTASPDAVLDAARRRLAT